MLVALAVAIAFVPSTKPAVSVSYGPFSMKVFAAMDKVSTEIPEEVFITTSRKSIEPKLPVVDIAIPKTEDGGYLFKGVFDHFNARLDAVDPPHGKPGKRQTERRTPHQVQALFKSYSQWPVVKQLGMQRVALTELFIEPRMRHLSIIFYRGETAYIVDAFWDGPNQPSEQVENAQFEAMAKSITLR